MKELIDARNNDARRMQDECRMKIEGRRSVANSSDE
jgi:hypothetical protein